MTPCIITCAITGSLPKKADNPAVPITPAEQIESTHEAFEAGATLVHLHVRNDDGSPTSSPERFAVVQEGIRKHCPGMIVQFSTGGRSGAGKERGAHLELAPDMASLATGSVNFPTRVYDNSPDLVDWLAVEMRTHKIKPEVEAFDLSMIFQAAAMQADGERAGLPYRKSCQAQSDAGCRCRPNGIRPSCFFSNGFSTNAKNSNGSWIFSVTSSFRPDINTKGIDWSSLVL